ncbi:MAG: carbohydrate-binding protein [Desulfocucumaceae bacterium]
MKSIKPYQFSQDIHGVRVKPLAENGKDVRVRYEGLLSSSGAANVTLHYGFGEADDWKDTGNIEMEKMMDGWESSVSMRDSQLNFCFRDTIYNWDNNNGLNWTYRLS